MKIRLRDIECRFSQNRYEIVKWLVEKLGYEFKIKK
jgi:hypothetical protein